MAVVAERFVLATRNRRLNSILGDTVSPMVIDEGLYALLGPKCSCPKIRGGVSGKITDFGARSQQ